MVEFYSRSLDWILIRQALSLSLLSMKPVKIFDGMRFINSNPEFHPVLSDIESLVVNIGAGRFTGDENAIIYQPSWPREWRVDFTSGRFSSLSELILFLAPFLFSREFRSVLYLKGVTHSLISHATSFLNETLFSFLERMGFYAGIVLRRYGFYGSGGGEVEARFYPFEKRNSIDITGQEKIEIARARIIFSRLGMNYAGNVRDYIIKELKLDAAKVSIIEVLDSDGMGISVSLYLESWNKKYPVPVPVIIPVEMKIYNWAGDFVFDEEDNNDILKSKIECLKTFMNENILPQPVFRESALYMYLSGVREIQCRYGGDYKYLTEAYDLFNIG